MNSRWNSTEAYDLSLYEAPVQPVKRPQPAPAAKTSRAAAKKAMQKTALRRLTVCAVLVVVFLALVLYQNVSTIELGNEIQTQNDLYAALQNEVLNAVNQHALFFAAALPRTLSTPLFNRYQNNETYGFHVDGAVRSRKGAVQDAGLSGELHTAE